MNTIRNQSRKAPGLRVSGKQLLRLKRFIGLTLNINVGTLLEDHIKYLNTVASNRGLVSAMIRGKALSSQASRYAAGHKPSAIPFDKTTKSGVSRSIKNFLPLLDGSINSKRAALCILSIWKLVKVNAPYSLSTITDKGLVTPLHPEEEAQVGGYFSRSNRPDLHQVWKEVLESMFPSDKVQDRLKKLKSSSGIHISTKKGPNGPAVLAAAIDWSSLDDKMKSRISALATLTDNKDLLKVIKKIGTSPQSFDGSINSKISLKVESGGKMRPFAIGDWFSQSSLKSIHSFLFSWLSSQPEDGTFSHFYASEDVKNWTKDPKLNKEIYGSDLTAATDLFPRDLEREVLLQAFGPEISSLWVGIIADRDFKAPNGSFLRYGVGNPMGLLSSWATFAVAHHAFTRMCYRYCNTPSKGMYRIIGDDVVTLGHLPSQMYASVMTNTIGVPVSSTKSMTPMTSINPGNPSPSVEFAKRIFIDGKEITPLSPDEILQGLEYSIEFPALLESLSRRGWVTASFEDPAPSLARLGDKPNQALRHATFPCNPAPNYVGVTALYKGLGPLGDRSLGCTYVPPWWSYPYDEIEKSFSGLLRKTIVDALKNSRTILKETTSLSKSSEPLKVSRWHTNGKQVGPVLVQIVDSTIMLLNKALGGLALKANVPSSDLKLEIAKYHVLLDLSLVLQGESNRKDEKSRTRYLIAGLSTKVLRRLEE